MNPTPSRAAMFCLMSLLGVGAIDARADDLLPEDPLVGVWTLCEDPDGSPKEDLYFEVDGSGLVERAKGDLPFTYTRTGVDVVLTVTINGRSIPVPLTASPGFDRLSLFSPNTGNTATYLRVEDPAAVRCTIR